MGFIDQTSAFFDELSKIVTKDKKSREETFGSEGKSTPFSNLLTQDEEPTDYHNRISHDKDIYHLTNQDSLKISFALVSNNVPVATKTFTFFGNSYLIDLSMDLTTLSDIIAPNYYELVWLSGLSPTEKILTDDTYYSKAYAYSGEEYISINVKKGKRADSKLMGNTIWTAIRTKYFATAFISKKPALGYKLGGYGKPLEGKDYQKVFNMHLYLPVNSSSTISLYLGPLDYKILKDLSVNLENIMNFGWKIIQPISKGILWTFIKLHSIIPNYGVVLIIFSILIKILLLPLTNISMRSMKEMQKIQPLITELREKYKNDPQKLNAATMRLYKEHGVNPMGGCLPLLLQMPILYALFIIFRTTIELRHAPFVLWITDLSSPDTIYTLPFAIPLYGQNVNVLPIIMALSTILQQKMSTATTNPQQKFTMYLMPIMFFFIFNQFPSGLNLYYTLFNLLTVLQQKFLPPRDRSQNRKSVSSKQSAYKKSFLDKYRQIKAGIK